MLLEHGEEILETLLRRGKKGDRSALALCVERLIPRLKDAEVLPLEKEQDIGPDREPIPLKGNPRLKDLTDEELAFTLAIAKKLAPPSEA